MKAVNKLAARVCALALALVLAAGMALPAAAMAEGVPQAVLDSKGGVLRVIASLGDGYYSLGTGFAIGTEEDVYVATNHHVIEEATHIYVYYDTGRYIEATIEVDDAARDICILKPVRAIPRVKVLPIQTGGVGDGIAVFALGFPGAADTLADGFDNKYYDTDAEYLASVVADKASMTTTNGVVSAIRESAMVGDASRMVRLIQTNTAINKGNSGGPLLDRDGNVVGVNTLGLSGYEWHIESMNGSVHVDELISVLKGAHIAYNGPAEPEVSSSTVSQPVSSQPQPQAESGGPSVVIILLVVLGVLVLGGGALAAGLVARRGKKPPIKGGVPLAEFERTGRGVSEVAAYEMVRAFVAGLLPLAGYDLNPLLTTTNVYIGDGAIALKEQGADPDAPPALYPGYSAPECYRGAAGRAATVYFIGALTYLLLNGERPPEAQARLRKNDPMYDTADTLQALVNRATEPYEQNRIPDLHRLAEQLAQSGGKIYAENGFAQPPAARVGGPPQQYR